MPKSKRQTRKISARASTGAASGNGGRSGSLYEREFNPDYSLTIKDLRRIGILAGSFIGLLVVLSFFLR